MSSLPVSLPANLPAISQQVPNISSPLVIPQASSILNLYVSFERVPGYKFPASFLVSNLQASLLGGLQESSISRLLASFEKNTWQIQPSIVSLSERNSLQTRGISSLSASSEQIPSVFSLPISIWASTLSRGLFLNSYKPLDGHHIE